MIDGSGTPNRNNYTRALASLSTDANHSRNVRAPAPFPQADSALAPRLDQAPGATSG